MCHGLSPLSASGTKRAGDFWSKSVLLELQTKIPFFWEGCNHFYGFEEKNPVFWVLSWQTSLLYMVGELAGGGSVAVAICVGDR